MKQYDLMKKENDEARHLMRSRWAMYGARENELRSEIERLKGRVRREEEEKRQLVSQLGSAEVRAF